MHSAFFLSFFLSFSIISPSRLPVHYPVPIPLMVKVVCSPKRQISRRPPVTETAVTRQWRVIVMSKRSAILPFFSRKPGRFLGSVWNLSDKMLLIISNTGNSFSARYIFCRNSRIYFSRRQFPTQGRVQWRTSVSFARECLWIPKR